MNLYQSRDSNTQMKVVVATIGGTGSQNVNVFKITGSVRVLDQWAIITRVGTLTNLTGVYADLWDGSASVDLTADGAVLSGMPVGTFFTKDKVAANAYSVSDASNGALLETLDNRFVGRPFIVTAKNGADTYIRFNYTTTDNPVDFDMEIHFEYELMNNSTLELA
jgi:hypothetical protein